MHIHRFCWQILVIIGLLAMILGVFDPLEGSLLILPGSGLVALGAILGKTPQWKLLALAFSLVIIGIGAMVVLSVAGGVGGRAGHSLWWLLAVIPYPIGWLMGLYGVLRLVASGGHRTILCGAVILAVVALVAKILLCSLHSLIVGMAPVVFYLLTGLPLAISLIMALAGGVFWMVKSSRVASH